MVDTPTPGSHANESTIVRGAPGRTRAPGALAPGARGEGEHRAVLLVPAAAAAPGRAGGGWAVVGSHNRVGPNAGPQALPGGLALRGCARPRTRRCRARVGGLVRPSLIVLASVRRCRCIRRSVGRWSIKVVELAGQLRPRRSSRARSSTPRRTPLLPGTPPRWRASRCGCSRAVRRSRPRRADRPVPLRRPPPYQDQRRLDYGDWPLPESARTRTASALPVTDREHEGAAWTGGVSCAGARQWWARRPARSASAERCGDGRSQRRPSRRRRRTALCRRRTRTACACPSGSPAGCWPSGQPVGGTGYVWHAAPDGVRSSRPRWADGSTSPTARSAAARAGPAPSGSDPPGRSSARTASCPARTGTAAAAPRPGSVGCPARRPTGGAHGHGETNRTFSNP